MIQTSIFLITIAIILFPALFLLYLTRRMKKKINEEIKRLDREIQKMRREQKDLKH